MCNNLCVTQISVMLFRVIVTGMEVKMMYNFVSGCFRLFHIVSGGFRRFQAVSDGFRWFQMVSDGFRRCWK
ncbi:MAG: hypothetical protein JXB24_08315 [Bacteroidales bacterium]|nr:hypothetical protein [Bacteroidales bacterium]